MCTASIIALPGGGFRLVTSRDEMRQRPSATPPAWRDGVRGDARAVWPVDALAGGTWVAAGEHGLALTLLNGNPRTPLPPPADRLSRGVIIPQLIGSADAPAAAAVLAECPLGRFEPFRLIGVDAGAGSEGEQPRVVDCRWDGHRLSTTQPSPPVCFASSGLGDWLVECRVPLFGELVADAGASTEAQDVYHRHRWPDRPEVSVLMEREEARTVSITWVEVRPASGGRFEVRMEHEPIDALAPR